MSAYHFCVRNTTNRMSRESLELDLAHTIVEMQVQAGRQVVKLETQGRVEIQVQKLCAGKMDSCWAWSVFVLLKLSTAWMRPIRIMEDSLLCSCPPV